MVRTLLFWTHVFLLFLGMALQASPGYSAETDLPLILRRLNQSPTAVRLFLAWQKQLGKSLPDGIITTVQWSSRVEYVWKNNKVEKQLLINIHQSSENILLDLVHEMTHFLNLNPINPQNPTLEASPYLTHWLLGPGGESEALANECRVAWELAKANDPLQKTPTVCGEVRSDLSLEAQLGNQLFRVGSWKRLLIQVPALSPLYPLFSEQPPSILSSNGRLPYPITVYNEFLGLKHAHEHLSNP